MWLRKQNLKTICDFHKKVDWNWQLRENKRILIIIEVQEKRAYEKSKDNKYLLVDYSEELEQGNFVGIIGTLYSNGVLKIQMVNEPM